MSKKVFSLFLLLVLVVALVPAAVSAQGEGSTYTVQADDWLSKLAEKEYGDVLAYPAIVYYNNLKAQEDSTFATIENPDLLEVGWVIYIPTADEATAFLSGETGMAAESDLWGVAVIAPGETIKIGMGAPMLGEYANFGIDIGRGAELAVADTPTIKGFNVEFLAEDTGGGAEGGAAVANLFAADPTVVGIAGHVFSGSTEAAIPIYEAAHIVMMSPSATNPTLTTLGSQIFNRVAFNDESQAALAANYIYNVLGIDTIAVMHDGTTYGQGVAVATQAAFEELGGTVVALEGITPGEADYRAPLTSISEYSPALIYYGGYDLEAAYLVQQMPEVGLADTILFSDDGTFGKQFLDLAGASAEGHYATNVQLPESDALTEFASKYEAAYGDAFGELSPFSQHGYDSAAVILSKIDEVSSLDSDGNLLIPRKALADAVRHTTGYQGLTGNITCSSNGECSGSNVLFQVVQDGDWTVAPGQ